MINITKKLKIYLEKNSNLINSIIYIYNIVGFRYNKRNGKNNTIIYSKALLRQINLSICGSNNHVEISRFARLNNVTIKIQGNNHRLYIGEKCRIRDTSLWISDENGAISIGNKTTMEGVHIASIEPNSKIKIGEDCMFSRDIELRTGDSHSIFNINTKKRINYPSDIVISDHVWIGAYAKILKGVKIGKDSIVGMGSIVTKSIPNNVTCAGIPAKIINKEVSWSRERLD